METTTQEELITFDVNEILNEIECDREQEREDFFHKAGIADHEYYGDFRDDEGLDDGEWCQSMHVTNFPEDITI